jgi:putative ABC transport system permease protein
MRLRRQSVGRDPVSWTRQTFLLVTSNWLSMWGRAGNAIVAVVGFAGVSIILISLFSLRQGMREMYELSGRQDVAVVVARGARSEAESTVPDFAAPAIAAMLSAPPARLVSAEYTSNNVQLPPEREGVVGVYVWGRGTSRGGMSTRPDLRLVEGRSFESGRAEAIVGLGLVRLHPVLTVGSEVRVRNTPFSVVGIFATGSGVSDYEVWMDNDVYRSTAVDVLGAGALVNSSSIWVRLNDDISVERINSILDDEYFLEEWGEFSAFSQRELLRMQSNEIIANMTLVTVAVALIVGAAAVFGAVNTMFTAVSMRAREITTLRALGFQSSPIAISILSEALTLAAFGALIGAMTMSATLRHLSVPWISGISTPVVLQFSVTPSVVFAVVLYAFLLGLLSSALPLLRAVRLPITMSVVR